MDYGKFKYDRKKRTKQASSAHTHDLKEIRIRPKTDTHDRSIKLKRAIGFLGEGRKVQFTMLFRGRERFHKERAVNIFDGILEELGETVKVERRPIMDGRRMTMVVSPVKAGGPKPPKPQKKTPQPAKAKKPPTTAGAPPVKADATPTAASAPPVQADVSPETPAAPVVKADATPTETDAAPDAPKTSDTPAPLP